jgi:DNA-binding response OmpR family regulator
LKVQLFGLYDLLAQDLRFLLRCRWDDAEIERLESYRISDTAARADLNVVDFGSHGQRTVQIVEQLSRESRSAILVISSGQIPVASQIAVLRAGADDVWEGFPPDVALGIARFVALRRRTEVDELLHFAELTINAIAREVMVGHDRALQLTPAEFRLLHTLVDHHERVLTFDQLIDTVWDESSASRSSLRKLVQRLRAKLGRQAGVHIESQAGIGYRLVATADELCRQQGVLQG